MSFTHQREPMDLKLRQLVASSAASSAALARKKRREKMSFSRSTSNSTSINFTKESNSPAFQTPQPSDQVQQKESKEKVPPKKRKFNHILMDNKDQMRNIKDDPKKHLQKEVINRNDAAEEAIKSLQMLSSKTSAKKDINEMSTRTDDASIWNVHANNLLHLSGKHNQTQLKSLPIPHTRPTDLSLFPAAAPSAVSVPPPKTVKSPPSPSLPLAPPLTPVATPPVATPPVATPSQPLPTLTPIATPTSTSKPRKRSKKAVSAVEIAKAKEIRMLRNRASAAAHRQRNRNLIETLQNEVETWKHKYNSAIDRQRQLESELTLLKSQTNNSQNIIGTPPEQMMEKSEQGNTKKGPVWKKLIDVFSS